MAKNDLMSALRSLLNDATRARFEGGPHAKFARAQGLVDGYMRALLDSGLASRDELLSLVADEHAKMLAEPVATAAE